MCEHELVRLAWQTQKKCHKCGLTEKETILTDKLASAEKALADEKEAKKQAEILLAVHCEMEEAECYCDKFFAEKQRAEQAEKALAEAEIDKTIMREILSRQRMVISGSVCGGCDKFEVLGENCRSCEVGLLREAEEKYFDEYCEESCEKRDLLDRASRAEQAESHALAQACYEALMPTAGVAMAEQHKRYQEALEKIAHVQPTALTDITDIREIARTALKGA